MKWELNLNGAGVGGATNVTMEKSDVYTLAEEFTYTVKAESSYTEDNQFTLNGEGVSVTAPGDITESGLTFNYALFETTQMMIFDRIEDFVFDKATVSELIPYFSNITNGHVLNIRLTVTGAHSVKEYTSKIMVVGYTNSSVISDIQVDTPNLVF